MSNAILKVTDESFAADVLMAAAPVVVDFWADWCGPCKAIAPLLEEAAERFAGQVRIAKLNIDDNPDTPAKYGVRGIPTLMVFKEGKLYATKVGSMSRQALMDWLAEALD